MAKARKTAQADLPAQRDPAAPLDAVAFLRAAQPVLRRLTEDLLVRADASTHVTAALKTKHTEARAQHRTAEDYVVWRRAVVTQVAAAWLLSCVFIRVLEDRGLIHARLAGAAASDSERTFFQFAPSLSHREYLLMTFRELTRLPAAAELFDSKHNLVWRLAPSDAACKDLLQLFRGPSIEAPAFRFGQLDTRFLGDLYQDIDADTREFYALLQTPDFVESFILDHTLEPAIREYGIDNADLIDPTCGSGHFLLGAFPRFLDHLRRAHPAMDDRELARRALDKIFGVDINPYAASIARFRLFLAFVEVCKYPALREATTPPIHVVPADSLLYGFAGGQGDLSEREEKYGSEAFGEGFNLEDAKGAREILAGRRYTAVVGNPPYITVKDSALREKYRDRYTAAAGKYALSTPFMERFFALGKGEGGYIGQITSNSFMKREFGKALIEKVLREVELTHIVNTAGAFIPGHSTPTVIVFGRNNRHLMGAPRSSVLAVLAKHGEPGVPAIPAKGMVWGSILAHAKEIGFENEFISVSEVERSVLDKHPWALEGGGAGQLKDILEQKAFSTLGAIADSIGISCVTGEDDVYLLPDDVALRLQVGKTRPLVTGENIRDWGASTAGLVVFPYQDETLFLNAPHEARQEVRYLWNYRSIISHRKRFGIPMLERGLSWYELQELYRDKFATPWFITYAEVATHNHFFLDRGGKVFKQTAPIIKLPHTSTEDDHLGLLAYLNSSTVCFWMKQVSYPKSTTNKDINTDRGKPEDNRYAFAATAISKLPIPTLHDLATLIPYARSLEALQRERASCLPETVVADSLAQGIDLTIAVSTAGDRERSLLHRMVAIQEDLDWAVYAILGLAPPELATRTPTTIGLASEQRPFNASAPPTHLAETDPIAFKVWQARAQRVHQKESKQLRLIENAVNKRRWWGARGVFAHKVATFEDRCITAVEEKIADLAEGLLSAATTVTTHRALEQSFAADRRYQALKDFLADHEVQQHPLFQQLERESAPFVAGFRYSESGREKYALWCRTWDSQRLVDEYEQSPPSRVDLAIDGTNFSDSQGNLHRHLEQALNALANREQAATAHMRRWGVADHPDAEDLARVQALVTAAISISTRALTTPSLMDQVMDALSAFSGFYENKKIAHRVKRYFQRLPIPPRYDVEDYRSSNFFRLRGKLDVPKERFISYPGCASDVDLEPVYGWAGWDHLQRALALFQLYYARKDEAWKPERLLPMLAGLEELLPWVRQWHAEARSPETGQLYHEYFDQVIASEAAELGFSRAQLATWAPPERGAGRKSAKATPSSADDSDTDAPATDGESPTPKRKPGRKPKAAASSDGSETDAPTTDGEPAAPRRKPGRKPKASATTDGSDPAPARARKSKSADKTPPSTSE